MNKIVCKNCNSENDLFRLNCYNCNALLRTRVVNIDLWKTVGRIVENPIKAFKEIIQAEHKNFIFILLFFLGIKYFANALFFSESVYKVDVINNFIWINWIVFSGIFFLFVFSFSMLITFVNKSFKIQTRYRDNLSIYIYSFIPQLFALITLLPIEFALFGQYWFTKNPEPFVIRPVASYILFILEIICIIWSVLLFILSTFIQTSKIVYSIFIGLISIILLCGLIFFVPLIVY
ncbi:MAG: hypothetical protein JXA68_06650 [Ignavibacteriales bacterium]|nr:hypothetical protein [Ignavibacteriales bacterium]